ncbi:hypothetical protein ACFE04_019942 [Oxalis oulophora]
MKKGSRQETEVNQAVNRVQQNAVAEWNCSVDAAIFESEGKSGFGFVIRRSGGQFLYAVSGTLPGIENRKMSTKSDINVESGAAAKGKAPLIGVVAKNENARFKRVLGIIDFVLRLCAIVPALAAAAAMGTSDETLPFFTQFFQFQASYDDLPTFQFFVVAMALVSGYLVLSLPFSIVTILRPHAAGLRILLLILDTVALTLATAAGSAATAIVYLAHNGNQNTNWLAICQQFGDFCQKVSGAVVASFVAVVIFVFIVLLSGFALRRH